MIFQSPIGITANSFIKVELPDQTSLYQADDFTCFMEGTFDAPSDCYYEGTNSVVFPIPDGIDLPARSAIQITFNGIFTAPRTTTPTDSFQVMVFRPDGETKTAENLDSFILQGLDRAEIQEATIK